MGLKWNISLEFKILKVIREYKVFKKMAEFKCQKSYHFLTDGQESRACGIWSYNYFRQNSLKDKQNDHHFWVIYATENSSWLEWFFPWKNKVTNFFKCLIILLTLFYFNGENYLLCAKKRKSLKQRVNLKENCHKKFGSLNEAR